MNRDCNIKCQLNEITRLCACILNDIKCSAQTQTTIKKTLTNGFNVDSKSVNFNEENWDTKPNNYAEALDYINERIKDISKLNDIEETLALVLNIEEKNVNFNEENWETKPDNYAEALEYINEQIRQILNSNLSNIITTKLNGIERQLENLADELNIKLEEDITINYECPSELREFFEYFHGVDFETEFEDKKHNDINLTTILKNIEPLFIYKFDNNEHKLLFDMFYSGEDGVIKYTVEGTSYKITTETEQTYEFKIRSYTDHSIITTSNNLDIIKPNNMSTTSKHPIIELTYDECTYYIVTTYNEFVFNNMAYNKYRTRPNNSFISIPFMQLTKITPTTIQDANTLQSFINANSDLYEHMHVWAKSGCIPGMYFVSNDELTTEDTDSNGNIIKKITTPLKDGYIYAQVKFMLPKTNEFISTNELKMDEYSMFEKLKYPINPSDISSNDSITSYKKYDATDPTGRYLYNISEIPADHWPEICQVYYCGYIPKEFPTEQ